MAKNPKQSKKLAPIICAAVVIALLLGYLTALLIPLAMESLGLGAVAGILVIYAVVIVAAIIGVVAALKQRLKEIESGEEEDAKKY